MTEPLLTLQGVAKRFGAAVALDHVDLTIARGSFDCLIGPSGCGKTTLLRILCGLERSDHGRILRGETDIAGLEPAKRDMGLVFQSYALFPNLTVASNVAFGLPRRLSGRERKAKVEALLETVGLGGLGGRRPDQLSGGQQQRVAIARALAPQPSILLLDEPLSALDPQIRAQVRGELKAMQRRLGITTIMVTHDQAEALAIADRIAVMRAGRVVQAGTPLDIYRRPVDRFVAAFLGSMNFLRGTVEGGGVRLAAGPLIGLPSDLPPGTPVEIGIRPEQVMLGGSDLTLTVTRREFTGALMRLECAGHHSLSLMIDVPAAGPLPEEGSTITAGLPLEHLYLFAQGAGA